MTYYQRYIKIMQTTNKKNYPLSKLLFNYTSHDYEPLDFRGTYYDSTANESPNQFDLMTKRSSNKYDIITNYSNKYKHEIFIDLFKYNDLTHEYEFIPDSFYDKKKQMYYLYEKIKKIIPIQFFNQIKTSKVVINWIRIFIMNNTFLS